MTTSCARLPSVLEVIYLIFNEGYAATAGEDWMRPELCEEALRLGRILAELLPGRARGPRPRRADGDPGLTHARPSPGGQPVLLLDQDRSRWDRLLIRPRPGGAGPGRAARGRLGPYYLQAAIAACHAQARTAEETDWPRIVALYDALGQLAPSPVVELNRAVAISMAYGPRRGARSWWTRSVRSRRSPVTTCSPASARTCWSKLGRRREARAELERAVALARNDRERTLLRERVTQLG